MKAMDDGRHLTEISNFNSWIDYVPHFTSTKHFVWNHKSFESFHSGPNQGSVLEHDQLTRCLHNDNRHIFADVVVIGDCGFMKRFSHLLYGRDRITTVRRSPTNSAVY